MKHSEFVCSMNVNQHLKRSEGHNHDLYPEVLREFFLERPLYDSRMPHNLYYEHLMYAFHLVVPFEGYNAFENYDTTEVVG